MDSSFVNPTKGVETAPFYGDPRLSGRWKQCMFCGKPCYGEPDQGDDPYTMDWVWVGRPACAVMLRAHRRCLDEKTPRHAMLQFEISLNELTGLGMRTMPRFAGGK